MLAIHTEHKYVYPSQSLYVNILGFYEIIHVKDYLTRMTLYSTLPSLFYNQGTHPIRISNSL